MSNLDYFPTLALAIPVLSCPKNVEWITPLFPITPNVLLFYYLLGLIYPAFVVPNRKAAGPKLLRRSSALPPNQIQCSSNPRVELHKRFTELSA